MRSLSWSNVLWHHLLPYLRRVIDFCHPWMVIKELCILWCKMDVNSWIVPNVRSTCWEHLTISLCFCGNSSITIIQQLENVSCTGSSTWFPGYWKMENRRWKIVSLVYHWFHYFVGTNAKHMNLCKFLPCVWCVCVFFSPFWLACSRFKVFYPCRPWQQLIQVRFHDLLLTYFLNLHVLTLLTNDN